ncbi:MAG: hypothetical protein WDN45_03410 [Caulobacteraceae bacterium]
MGDRTDRGRTAVERRGERELVVTRLFDAPARLVFDAWTRPELFILWWRPSRSACPCCPARWMSAPAAATA